MGTIFKEFDAIRIFAIEAGFSRKLRLLKDFKKRNIKKDNKSRKKKLMVQEISLFLYSLY
jgi:hypothetical protein